MKIIGTERELLIALDAFMPLSAVCTPEHPLWKEPHIEEIGLIGMYHGVPIEIELSEDYRTYSDDRLGLAWARLNTWKWDCLFGKEPEGFNNLPNFSEKIGVKCKYQFIKPLMKKIEEEFAKRATSKAWWLHELGKTEEEWKRWYFEDKERNLDETI